MASLPITGITFSQPRSAMICFERGEHRRDVGVREPGQIIHWRLGDVPAVVVVFAAATVHARNADVAFHIAGEDLDKIAFRSGAVADVAKGLLRPSRRHAAADQRQRRELPNACANTAP